VSPPNNTDKKGRGVSSDYQVVLGGFSAQKKEIPRVGLVVNLARSTSLPASPVRAIHHAQLSRPAARIVRGEYEESAVRKHHRRSSFSFSKTLARALIALVALNPFVSVYADELPPTYADIVIAQTSSEIITDNSITPSATPEASVGETENTAIPESSPASEEPVSEPSLLENIISAVVDIFTPGDANETISTSTPEIISDPVVVTPELIETATSTEEIFPNPEPEEIATTTDEILPTSESTASSTEPVLDPTETPSGGAATTPKEESATVEEITTEEATTTEEVIDENQTPEPSAPTETSSEPAVVQKVFFKDSECTPTDDGGYYCVSKNLGNTTDSTIGAPRVFAEAIEGDDKEIYYEDATGKSQITRNEYDDDAPSYDENSQIILWHALINGRYQIMFYDKNQASTGFRQLTDSDYNNTNPYVSGHGAVWQGWVNGNWEVFYAKDVMAPELEVRQITSSERNDMFPHLSEKFITWQSFYEDMWHVFVYDMTTGETSQITKSTDGKYENPRFALLFEKRDENGEVKTIGYDIASGQEIPISHGGSASSPLIPLSQPDSEKAMPLSGTGTSTLKTLGKDGDNTDSGE
jgi:hypothetical protein